MANKIESWLKATNTKEEGLGELKRERRRSFALRTVTPSLLFRTIMGGPPPNQRLLYMRRDPTMLICNFLLQNSRGRRSRSTNTQQLVIAQISCALIFFSPMTGLGSKRFQQFQTFIRCNLGSLAELLSAQSHQHWWLPPWLFHLWCRQKRSRRYHPCVWPHFERSKLGSCLAIP